MVTNSISFNLLGDSDHHIKYELNVRENETILQIRQAEADHCADYNGEYWRALDREGEYPTEFVNAHTLSGFLACLIP